MPIDDGILKWLKDYSFLAGWSGWATVGILVIGWVFRKRVLFMVPRAFRWFSRKILTQCTLLIIRWRERKAGIIVELSLEGTPGIHILADLYRQSLREHPTTSRRTLLEFVKVDYPKWLNDYYVARALESLATEGRIVKANQYADNAWPPNGVWGYLFRHEKQIASSESVEAESRLLETESWCMVYQRFYGVGKHRENIEACFVRDRFERTPYSKTLSDNKSQHGENLRLKESAPPCQRCWERNAQERSLRMLVTNFLENELHAELMSLSLSDIQDECFRLRLSSARGPFIESIVSVCVESGISHEEKDMATVLDITKRGIAIYDGCRKEHGAERVSDEVLKRDLKQHFLSTGPPN